MTRVAPVRIALFGSFYRGYFLLDELLHGPHRHRFDVVGVATDDPSQSYVSPGKRVWDYPHAAAEETMVEEHAMRHGIPVYKERVKCEAFYSLYEQTWRPQLCVAATFGQRLNARLFRFPVHGFFNLHPCVSDRWPSRYSGPNPFQAMRDDGQNHVRVALHRVDEGFDSGELIAYSRRISMPPQAGVTDMHKISAPVAAQFCIATLLARIDQAPAEGAADTL